MWLKQLTSIFTRVAVMAILANCQDPVFLDENSTIPVTVPLGSPLILKCNLTRPTQIRNWVSWYFNSDEPSPTNPLKKVTNDTDLDKTMFRVTSNAKEKDSGWYFCNVTIDIPTLRTISSSGRKVVITAKTVEHTTHSSHPIVTSTQAVPVFPLDSCQGMDCKHWAILGVFAVILIVLPVALFFLRKRFHTSTVDEPIYTNTRPVANKQPSPRPRMQLHPLKTASSSQNFGEVEVEGRYEDGKRRNKH